MSIIASDWLPMERNTLNGFLTLTCHGANSCCARSACQKGDKRWVGLPSNPQIDPEGRRRTENGKRLYVPVVEITGTEARHVFQRAALAGVGKLLGNTP
jgi:hypothetical protein